MPPELNNTQPSIPAAVPSPKQQSWGAVISIIIIILMVVIGAFYAWGKRISENVPPVVPADSSITQ